MDVNSREYTEEEFMQTYESYRKVWIMKRKLNAMPFDKRFEIDGNEELCHATGFEVCFGDVLGDVEDPADWWNEYIDSNGDFHYGR